MKHYNVALFIPHNGCPHQCSFCNQKEITGVSVQPQAEDIIKSVKIAKESLKDKTKQAEIAFFGGSFTAIDREYMISLLKAASPYVLSGEFYGIRISTRPDAIDDTVLSILKKYGVTAIELGAQSMCDDVLLANERGHTSDDVIKSSELIKSYGFSLGLQMMTGLYKSDYQKDVYTAHMLAKQNPDTVRIYPTVIMESTKLGKLYKSGEYVPMGFEETVDLCAELILYFEEKNIKVIRLGLHESESLKNDMISGVYHPAFREICESRILLKRAITLIEENNIKNGDVTFCISPKSLSKFKGQKKCNIDYLNSNGINPIIELDDTMNKYDVYIKTEL